MSVAAVDERVEWQRTKLRVVSAADEARSWIERNLHDGAQQQFIAIAIRLGLARQSAAEHGAAGMAELLDDVHRELLAAITELRELAHGLYPAILRERGLAAALHTAAMRCPLPHEVDVELPNRYPIEVEAAVYFCCVEALQNAIKHAGGDATVLVRLRGDHDRLCFEVTDTGAGFETGRVRHGAGLLNIRDRITALGGRLEVSSRPGGGTTVRGMIP
jgi:signal transduction histidine kinase